MPVRGRLCTFMAVCVTFLIPLSYLLSPLANSCSLSLSFPALRLHRCARQRKSRSLIFTDPHWRRVSKPRTTLMRQQECTNSNPAVTRRVWLPSHSRRELQHRRARHPPTRHATATLGCGNLQGFNVRRLSSRLSPEKKEKKKPWDDTSNYSGRGAAPTPLAYIALSI